jgi:hypothetical protein
MDPVLSAQNDRAHPVLCQIGAQFQLRVLQKASQPLPDPQSIFAGATVRFLAKDKTLTYITRLPDNSRILKAYSNGTLCIVVSDVIVDSMDIVLKIDKKLNAGFDANLRRKVNRVFGDGDKLQVKIGINDNGFYILRITRPVIVARLIASQAFGAARGADFKGKLGKWNRGWIPIALADEESQPEN